MTLAENIARLRVAAATGRIPADLARWAAETIVELTPAAERMEARNALLREAAARVSGSLGERARRLHGEVLDLQRHPRLRERSDDGGVRELVAKALEVDPGPTARGPLSLRQIRRVLEG
jgi:hypothetical protein